MELRTIMEVVPFVIMVIMEGCTIGLTILAKTAMTYGMSPFVFIVYTNVLSTSILLPYSFIFHSCDRTEQQPSITPGLLWRFFLLGLTGVTITQYLVFIGLDYSSPILVCAMGLLIPTFSFLLAMLRRTVKLDLRSPSIKAKIVGTLISVLGAIFVNLYKGPVVEPSTASFRCPANQFFVYASAPDNWILGGILLAGSSLSISVWNIIQMETVKHYPQVVKILSFYSLIGTLQCVVVSLAVERDISAWKLSLNWELILIIATAIFGVIRSCVQIWCIRVKGPAYVPMFKPFGILYASVFGACFFGSSLHYGSIVGAVIVGIGYYAFMWGQIIEDQIRQGHQERSDDAIDDDKVPLLQEEPEV